MKRLDLERKLRIAGCYMKREGSFGLILKMESLKPFPGILKSKRLARKILKNLDADNQRWRRTIP